jgi:adenosylhomocysteine nucleosidase
LGVIAALPAEARSLAGQRIIPKQLIRLGESTLIYVAGIGEAGALSAAARLLVQGAKALVSWGTAGALEKTLAPGDLILPTAVADLGGTLQVNRVWHGHLATALSQHLPVHTGVLLRSREIIATTGQKAELCHKTGAVAVDMESAAIGQAANRAGVPFLIIRAIVDPQSMSIPTWAVQAADEYGKIGLWDLLSELRARPVELASLLRLAWNFHAALTSLRTVARLTGPKLCYDAI